MIVLFIFHELRMKRRRISLIHWISIIKSSYETILIIRTNMKEGMSPMLQLLSFWVKLDDQIWYLLYRNYGEHTKRKPLYLQKCPFLLGIFYQKPFELLRDLQLLSRVRKLGNWERKKGKSSLVFWRISINIAELSFTYNDCEISVLFLLKSILRME